MDNYGFQGGRECHQIQKIPSSNFFDPSPLKLNFNLLENFPSPQTCISRK